MARAEADRGAPLVGLDVLDLTQLLPGPYATRQLVRLGARVVKIEPPGGDPARYIGARPGHPSPLFLALNEGKEYRTLDLKQPADREQLVLMATSADAVVEGFRPGVLNRLGLGWDVLQRVNPRIVLCSITAHGSSGPDALRASHDIECLALSGLLDTLLDGTGCPTLCGLPLADLYGGAQPALIELMAALLAAARTGQGRHVEVSMTHSLIDAQVQVLAPLREATGDGRPDLLAGALPCYAIYRTRDERHLAVGALEHREWLQLCQVIERPDLGALHWTQPDADAVGSALYVRQVLGTVFGSRDWAHWTALFAGVRCAVSPVLTLDEARRRVSCP